jgi:hypothetical protein
MDSKLLKPPREPSRRSMAGKIIRNSPRSSYSSLPGLNTLAQNSLYYRSGSVPRSIDAQIDEMLKIE